MSVMASRPVLRWVVPAGALAVVLGAGAVTTLRASADASLPPRSAAQLLVDLQTARLDGISGTVVERADLGLPMLPGGIGGDGSSQLNSMITGSHTLRVWYSGTDKARIALLGGLGESDVIYNGKEAWIWSSSTNSATHFTPDTTTSAQPAKPPIPHGLPSGLPSGLPHGLPSGLPHGLPHGLPSGLPSDLPTSPQDAAERILALVTPTTTVSTDGSAVVAGHAAYELVLQPKDRDSLVDQVRIAIDGKEHVPTRVEVFAKGQDAAAFEIGFTQVSFTRPDDGVFKFTPPPGATVTEANKDADKDAAHHPGTVPDKPEAAPKAPKTARIGTGWTTVFVARLPEDVSTTPDGKAPGKPDSKAPGKPDGKDPGLGGMLTTLPEVHGSFGTGRVLQSKLFSVLLLDDGRVLAGAVKPERLVAAAADPAAALK